MKIPSVFLSRNREKAVYVSAKPMKVLFLHPEKLSMDVNEIGKLDDFFDAAVKEEEVPGVFSGMLPASGNRPALFLKKRVYSGLYFKIRNLFMPLKPFRRAEWAEIAESAGISTPDVLMAGAKIQGGIIHTIYLIMEAVTGTTSLEEIFARPDARARVNLFIEDGSRIIASLHRAQLFHGDFHLSHFYYKGAVLSLWNPGWLQTWSGRFSEASILRDLASFGRSICECASRHRPALDDFIAHDTVAEQLLLAYAEVAPGYIPSVKKLVYEMNH